MEQHKVTFKTKDGTLKEQRFDDFNEFADLMQDVALDYYSGTQKAPEISLETDFSGIVQKETISNGQRTDSTIEFLGD